MARKVAVKKSGVNRMSKDAVRTHKLLEGNGRLKPTVGPTRTGKGRMIEVPPVQMDELKITLVGDRPLMVNNKMSVAEDVARQYDRSEVSGGKSKNVPKLPDTKDEQYAKAFYVMPSSKYDPPSPKAKYGIPASGIKKCFCKGIRPAGYTDNMTIGNIQKGVQIMATEGGLCELGFKRLERDIRPVNIGSGQKTVPQMRHRPVFHDWYINLTVRYNPKIIGPESVVNLFNHAGQFIGLCEMRAEKMQGECGGFWVKTGWQ